MNDRGCMAQNLRADPSNPAARVANQNPKVLHRRNQQVLDPLTPQPTPRLAQHAVVGNLAIQIMDLIGTDPILRINLFLFFRSAAWQRS